MRLTFRTASALALAITVTAAASPAGSASKNYYGVKPAAFRMIKPWKMPDIRFRDGQGREVRLAAFRGRVVLLHFWATWCHVCRHETPTVNGLAGRLRHPKLAIVALSVDRSAETARRYLKDKRYTHLALYHDAGMKALRAVGVEGTPTTFLINKQGYMVGFVEGAAGWNNADAVALLRHYIKE